MDANKDLSILHSSSPFNPLNDRTTLSILYVSQLHGLEALTVVWPGGPYFELEVE